MLYISNIWRWISSRIWSFLKTVRNWGISFIGLHYVYIFLLAIIGSIVMYPQKDIRYIDALFLSVCACTQAGLNTVNLNALKTYQQIALCVLSMVTTPIFIHSTIVFLRLYWFEKHFAGINYMSKLQSRMRRTATMARAETLQREAEMAAHLPPPKQTSPEDGSPLDSDRTSNSNSAEKSTNAERPPPPTDIRFGELPHPRRNESIAPQDMYMSINMMQRQRPTSDLKEDEEGPALVIKGPRAMDEEHERQERLGISRESTLAPGTTPPPAAWYGPPPFDEELVRSQSNTLENSSASQESVSDGMRLHQRAHTIEGDGVSANGGKIRDHLRYIFPHHAKGDKSSGPNEENGEKDEEEEEEENGNRKKAFKFPHSLTFDQFKHRLANNPPTDNTTNEEGGTPHLQRMMSANYLSWQPTVGRNSTFVDLTPEQKEELGGVEYRALKLLAKILVAYYVGFHVICTIMLTPYGCLRNYYKGIIESDGVNPIWWGVFTAQSTFNDVGFTLTPDSMESFQGSAYVLLVQSFFIVIGNTGFPCLLRFIIWVMFKLSPPFGQMRESLGFLLDHPRRCFTLLFPSPATWWLFAVLVVLNGLDWIFFIILDINNVTVEDIPVGFRVIVGLFQAFTTRTAGFTAVDIAELHASIQVSYMIMMYISVLPIAISIRRTNVYEEQSLGVYYSSTEETDLDKAKAPSFIANHLRWQLSFDLWYIFLGLFIITIAEGSHIENPKQSAFNTFNILFEITSAYGTVGLSMGYPGTDTSFSAQFNVIGKLVIIAMMLRGRHRGLPYNLDRAVMKPSEGLIARDIVQEHRTKNLMLMREPTINRTPSVASGFSRARRRSSAASMRNRMDSQIRPVQSPV